MLIVAGDGQGIKGIVTSIDGHTVTVINLMRGTYRKNIGEIEPALTP